MEPSLRWYSTGTPFDQVLVDDVIIGDERGQIGPGQLAERFFQGVGGHLWVEPLKHLPQPVLQDDLSVIVAVRPLVGPAQALAHTACRNQEFATNQGQRLRHQIHSKC